MLDLMPAPGLIFNEWKKHGTCSGLGGAQAYFETIRKARAAVKIPERNISSSPTPKMVAPADIEAAFVKANPGLTTSEMGVTCNRTRLSEVRICMGKDLQFRPCEEISMSQLPARPGVDAADAGRVAPQSPGYLSPRKSVEAHFAPDDPGIAATSFLSGTKDVDGRDKPGHDG